MSQVVGNIFDIQPFSVYDGPGIRTTVFLKGCNLRCKWCHNPESWESRPQLLFYEEKCIGCGQCVQGCPHEVHSMADGQHFMYREKCRRCGLCADNCYAGALKMSGKAVTADELFDRIEQENIYYQNSKGGVTFSGGEPLLQADFLKVILQKCKESGIHTAVDTAGCVSFQQFEKILPYTDLFLYDIKAVDTVTHEKLTGVENAIILENLQKLLALQKEVMVRIPCIKGANFHEIEQMAEKLQQMSVQKVELLPYHPMGTAKQKALSQEVILFSAPTREEMRTAQQVFTEKSILVEYKEN